MASELFTLDPNTVSFYHLELEIRAAIGTNFDIVLRLPDQVTIAGDSVTGSNRPAIQAVIDEHVKPPIVTLFRIPPAATRTVVEEDVGQTITSLGKIAFYMQFPGAINADSVVQPTADWWPT